MPTVNPSITSSGSQVRTLTAASVNNALRDPIQGFDCDVWVTSQATGQLTWVGNFTSIQIVVRNATEPYLELNQRVPRLLDGEYQMGWVLERGQLDVNALADTFGITAISRELRLSRSPRFQITFEMNAPELDRLAYTPNGEISNQSVSNRDTTGQYLLTFCKVDSYTIGVMAGRSVVANRWEGMCEGIELRNTQPSIWAGTVLDGAVGGRNNFRSSDPFGGATNIGLPTGLTLADGTTQLSNGGGLNGF